MSPSFRDQLYHSVHGRQIAKQRLTTLEVMESSEAIPFDVQRKNKLETIISTCFTCRDDELTYKKEMAYKTILGFIYGDIIEDLHSLLDRIFGQGDRKSIEIIKAIMEKVT